MQTKSTRYPGLAHLPPDERACRANWCDRLLERETLTAHEVAMLVYARGMKGR